MATDSIVCVLLGNRREHEAMDATDEYEAADRHGAGPRYANVAALDGWEIPVALQGLALFRDPYLSMQAQNLAIVDHFLNELEQRVLKRLHGEDRTPIDDAMFLNAQSQMWIFAAYEVMRTWRQRAKELSSGMTTAVSARSSKL